MSKPFNHPDYQIPGTTAFDLSKWSRENEPKAPPAFQPGDTVYYLGCDEVVRTYPDCDGTPLFELSNGQCGLSNEALLRVEDAPVPKSLGVEFHEEVTVSHLCAEIKRLRELLKATLPVLEANPTFVLDGPGFIQDLIRQVQEVVGDE